MQLGFFLVLFDILSFGRLEIQRESVHPQATVQLEVRHHHTPAT